MTYPDWKSRHQHALAFPASQEERTIARLLTELEELGTQYKNDFVMLPAVEHLGSAIIVLINGNLGRLDGASIDAKVREIVEQAGGDSSEL